jgi:sortase (surface protein transpeptidase)
VTEPSTGGRHREIIGRHRARGGPGRIAVRVGVATLVAVAASSAIFLPSSAPAAPSTTAARIPVPVSLVSGTQHEGAEPTRVRMPSIGVDSRLLWLGMDDHEALVPPSDFSRAGWFTGGPRPGETGPAVIAGHVESYEGPAVFFRLSELERGDEVVVDRADGTTARFTVTAVDRYPKDRFPTEQVYGSTPLPELRLITCGGEFDHDARSYRDNVVVSAVLAN